MPAQSSALEFRNSYHTKGRCKYLAALSVASVIAQVVCISEAWAQTAVAARGTSVEEIVVTARRTSENLEKVPAAITALNPRQLQERGITTETDLQLNVPGLTVRETENANTLTFSIRGQTVDAFTGSPTAVVPYVNEVPFYTGSSGSFYDLQSIQVLKGPQGTLFGRNATGGALLYTTAKPTNKFEGSIQGTVGNYGAFSEQGFINIPIIDDKVLFRAAFSADNRDGYIHNIYYNKDLGAVDRQSGRASLTLKPLDGLTNTTVVSYTQSLGNNTGDNADYVNPNGSAAFLFSPAFLGAAGYATYLAGNPHVPAGGPLAYEAVQRAQGPYVVDEIEDSGHREWGYYITNTTEYNLTDDIQLRNIVGYTFDHYTDRTSENGTPYGLQYSSNLATGEYGNRQKVEGLSEEFQVHGKAVNDDLTYIAGVFYQSLTTNILYPQTYFNLEPALPALSNVTDHFLTDDNTEAVYAQFNYNLGTLTGIEGLTFTAGYRYTWEDVGLNQLEGGPYPGANQDVTFSNPSWLASLSYQFSPELMIYASGSRSWRSGGLNGVAPPIDSGASGGGDLFEPEFDIAAEVGAKYGGRIYGQPVHANVSFFNQWVDGVQRAEFPSVGGHSIAVTINVPSAEVSGIEIDGGIRPTDWLEFGFAGSYDYARYTNGAALIFGTNYVFGPYADTPRVSGSVYGKVNLPVPDDWGVMSTRADIYGQAGQWYSDNGNTFLPNTHIPGYGLLNLRYDWNGIFGSTLTFSAFAKNVLNKVYYVGGLAQGISLGTDAVIVGQPQMYGFTLKYDFEQEQPSPPDQAAAPMPPQPAPEPTPAPAPAPEAQRSFQVFFDFDKSNISADAARIIHEAADTVKAGRIAHIQVVGHTDTVGSVRYNLRLSERRANAVKQQLIADGVSNDEIGVKGVGKSELLVPTPDGVREPQNRRAEIQLQSPGA